jgi:hypothetical protein
MAKYGLFDAANSKPLQEYEGDSLIVHPGEIVAVIAKEGGGGHIAVAAIRLAPSQSVKKI